MKSLAIFLLLGIVVFNNIQKHREVSAIDGEMEIVQMTGAAGTAIDLYVAGDNKALEEYSMECYQNSMEYYQKRNDWACIYFDIAAYRILSNESVPTEYFLESTIDSRNYSKIKEGVRLKASKELIESMIDHLMNNSLTVQEIDNSMTVEHPSITIIEE